LDKNTAKPAWNNLTTTQKEVAFPRGRHLEGQKKQLDFPSIFLEKK